MWKAHEIMGKTRYGTFLYLNLTLTYDVSNGSPYHYSRLPNYFFNNFFELFARKTQRGHPPAAKARVERIFMRAILSCSVLDKKNLSENSKQSSTFTSPRGGRCECTHQKQLTLCTISTPVARSPAAEHAQNILECY